MDKPFDKTCACGADIYKAGGSSHQDECPDCLVRTMPTGNGDENATPRTKVKVNGFGCRTVAKGGYRIMRKTQR